MGAPAVLGFFCPQPLHVHNFFFQNYMYTICSARFLWLTRILRPLYSGVRNCLYFWFRKQWISLLSICMSPKLFKTILHNQLYKNWLQWHCNSWLRWLRNFLSGHMVGGLVYKLMVVSISVYRFFVAFFLDCVHPRNA